MACAVVLGIFGGFAGLIFVGVIKFGGKWYSDSHPGWFGGHWWWVAVAAAAGVAVGLVRRLTRLPWETPGLFDDLQTAPILTAFLTAFLTMEGVKYLLARRKQARAAGAKPAAEAKPAAPV